MKRFSLAALSAVLLLACVPDRMDGRANGAQGQLDFSNASPGELLPSAIGAPVDVRVERLEGGWRVCDTRTCSPVPTPTFRKLVPRCDDGCEVVTSVESDPATSDDHHGHVRVIGRKPTGKLSVDVETTNGESYSDTVTLDFRAADELRIAARSYQLGLREAVLTGAAIELTLGAYAAGTKLAVARDAFVVAREGDAFTNAMNDEGTVTLTAASRGRSTLSFAVADLERSFELRAVDTSELAAAEVWRLPDQKSDERRADEALLADGTKIDALHFVCGGTYPRIGDDCGGADEPFALVLTTKDGARVLGAAPALRLKSGAAEVAGVSFGFDITTESQRVSTPEFYVSARGAGSDALVFSLGSVSFELPLTVTGSDG